MIMFHCVALGRANLGRRNLDKISQSHSLSADSELILEHSERSTPWGNASSSDLNQARGWRKSFAMVLVRGAAGPVRHMRNTQVRFLGCSQVGFLRLSAF